MKVFQVTRWAHAGALIVLLAGYGTVAVGQEMPRLHNVRIVTAADTGAIHEVEVTGAGPVKLAETPHGLLWLQVYDEPQDLREWGSHVPFGEGSAERMRYSPEATALGPPALPAPPFQLGSGAWVRSKVGNTIAFSADAYCGPLGDIGDVAFEYYLWEGNSTANLDPNDIGGAALWGGFTKGALTCPAEVPDYHWGWVQRIAASAPGQNIWGADPNEWFIDSSDRDDPDYPFGVAGYSAGLQDFPWRYLAPPSDTWHAELGLVCKNLTTDDMRVVATLLWGYDILANGTVREGFPYGRPTGWGVPFADFDDTVTKDWPAQDDYSDWTVANGCCCCVVLDFETEDDLTTALVNGQDVSTPPEFGELVSIGASSLSQGPAIFDTDANGPNQGPPYNDPDLLVGLGNALILQERPGQTVPGIFDFPDDSSAGGTFVFDFALPTEVRRLDLIDIDVYPVPQDAYVVLTDSSGDTRVYHAPSGWTEDIQIDGGAGYRALDTTTLSAQPGYTAVATALEDPDFDPQNVVRMEVFLTSSGAVDNIEICAGRPSAPSTRMRAELASPRDALPR